jgi:LPPG:FO 2-phospho-L-lactate transferase
MSERTKAWPSVVALAGGVGGGRLVHGLYQALPAKALTVVVNTGDDFRHWGLYISPDLDTVMYTLAEMAPEERGWGISGDTFEALAEMKRRGGEGWFQIGDRDLATHLFRTAALSRGQSLTEVTDILRRQLGVQSRILPMSDGESPTTIQTKGGEEIPFQRWLVEGRAEQGVARVLFRATPSPTNDVLTALSDAELVIICPSNPYVSIEPILSLPGVRDIILNKRTIAVSPIVCKNAVRGPLARMIKDIDQVSPSAEAVAVRYGEILNGFVAHTGDAFSATFPVLETNILIQTSKNRLTLAREVVAFGEELK